ncbi:MAG: recombinase family protein [Candidatus Izemoplasmatales bacterium]|nr:recombinase family protein [Candidatus Izemoplasmatales bacterium]
MIIGYTRVSTKKQNLESQQEAIKKFGIDKLYEEKASGRNTERPILNEVIDYLRPGDTLVIYDLSRLGRTVHQVMKLIDFFSANNIGFVSLKENMDISTPIGKAMVSIIATFNQMQVEIQNEKVIAGLDNAKRKGIKLGRKVISQEKVSLIQALSKQGYTNKKIAEHLNISIRTVINYKQAYI